jgi:hypothetical protein
MFQCTTDHYQGVTNYTYYTSICLVHCHMPSTSPLFEICSQFDVLLISKDQKHQENMFWISYSTFYKISSLCSIPQWKSCLFNYTAYARTHEMYVHCTSRVYYRQKVKLDCVIQSSDDEMYRTRGDRTACVCVCVYESCSGRKLAVSLSSVFNWTLCTRDKPIAQSLPIWNNTLQNTHRFYIYASSGMRTRDHSVWRCYVFTTSLTLVRCNISGSQPWQG